MVYRRIGKRIVAHAFVLELTATQAEALLGLDRKTVNSYYNLFRQAIATHQTAQMALLAGNVEVDESFFGRGRSRGYSGPLKQGGGTMKQPVFGIFERGGRVYAEIVPDAKNNTLQDVIRGAVALDDVGYSIRP